LVLYFCLIFTTKFDPIFGSKMVIGDGVIIYNI